MRLAKGLGAVEEALLNGVEGFADGLGETIHWHGLLLPRIAANEFDHAAFEIARAKCEANGDALHLVLGKLPAGAVLLAIIQMDANTCVLERLFDFAGCFEHGFVTLLAQNRDQNDLHGGELRREDDAFVVAVRHHQRTDQPRGNTPTRSPNIFQFVVSVLKSAIERLGEVLPEKVARTGLQRLSILHYGLNTIGIHCPGEALSLRLHAPDDWHRHPFLRKRGVDIQHLSGLLHRFLLGGVRRMAFLPEELGGAQEKPRSHLPPDHVRPLVYEDR